ncbi:MAG: hypothetical protein KatS3mg102_0677 [Planctomycetota bacterium]|nr:MAG: hypothetical protein KatS3mg102_0677 [Planctomycetota bacterium]
MDPGELRQVRQLIEKSTSKVSLRELEKKGFRKVKVLRSNDIDQMIRQAVAVAISRAGVDAAAKEELVRKSRDELNKLMRQAQQVEAERAELLEQNHRLESELRQLRTRLAEHEEAQREVDRLKRSLEEAQVQVLALQSRASTAEQQLAELARARHELEEARAQHKRLETEKRLLEELELPKLRERIAQLEEEVRQAREAARLAPPPAAGGGGLDPAELRAMMRDLVQEVAGARGDESVKAEIHRLQQSIASALAAAGGSRSRGGHRRRSGGCQDLARQDLRARAGGGGREQHRQGAGQGDHRQRRQEHAQQAQVAS